MIFAIRSARSTCKDRTTQKRGKVTTLDVILILVILAGFVIGWILGYYNIPSLKLSTQDAIEDQYEDAHPHRLQVVDRDELDAIGAPSQIPHRHVKPPAPASIDDRVLDP